MSEEDVKNPLIDGGEAMLATIRSSGSEIVMWTDDKKKDFVELFQKRSRVAQYLLVKTAIYVARGAIDRKFISDTRAEVALGQKTSIDRRYHLSPFRSDNIGCGNDIRTDLYDKTSTYCTDYSVGGRAIADLKKIAQERAQAVLSDLPPLRQVVNIIDVDTAEKIDKLEEITKKCKKLYGEFVELGKPVKMSTVDQNMTVSDFRKMVKDTVSKRQRLLDELNDLSKEGNDLDEHINTKLYKGLPGLTEAVEEVIKAHLARAAMFDQTTRRIEERVMFGDSEAAVSIMNSFEKDELEVDANIKKLFTDALEKLNISASAKKGKVPNATAKKRK